MRGPDSVPWYTLWDEGEPEGEPLSHILCPCCKSEDEANGTRTCLTYSRILTRDLAAFLSRPAGEIPFHGVTGWANNDEENPTLGCYRCGDAGVVPVDEREEVL